MKEIVIDIDGKLVPLRQLPCWKCESRYSIHCPTCKWNSDGRYNTYGGKTIETENETDKKKGQKQWHSTR